MDSYIERYALLKGYFFCDLQSQNSGTVLARRLLPNQVLGFVHNSDRVILFTQTGSVIESTEYATCEDLISELDAKVEAIRASLKPTVSMFAQSVESLKNEIARVKRLAYVALTKDSDKEAYRAHQSRVNHLMAKLSKLQASNKECY